MYRLIVLLLSLLLIAMQFQLWQQRASVRELAGILARQQDDNEQLRASNDALTAEVEDLRHGMQAVEERARSQLGLVVEGEQFIQLVPAHMLPDQSADTDAKQE